MFCQPMKFDIPVNLQAPSGAPPQETLVSEGSHVLPALFRGGYVTIKPMTSEGNSNMFMFKGGGYGRVDLTPTGLAAHVWNAESGFCIGRPRLVEVVRWTEPADRDGVKQTRITFTWRTGDRPDWPRPSSSEISWAWRIPSSTRSRRTRRVTEPIADLGLMADLHVLK